MAAPGAAPSCSLPTRRRPRPSSADRRGHAPGQPAPGRLEANWGGGARRVCRGPSPPRRRRLPWVMLAGTGALGAAAGRLLRSRGCCSSGLLFAGSCCWLRSSGTAPPHGASTTTTWPPGRGSRAGPPPLASALALERSARLIRRPRPGDRVRRGGREDRSAVGASPGRRRGAAGAAGSGEVASTVVVQDSSAGRALRPPAGPRPVTLDLAAARVTGVTRRRAGLARAALGQLLAPASSRTSCRSRSSVHRGAGGPPWRRCRTSAPGGRARPRPAAPGTLRPSRSSAALARLVSEAAKHRDDAATPDPPAHHRRAGAAEVKRGAAARSSPTAGQHGVLVLLTADAPSDLPHETALVRTDDGSSRLTGSEVATTRTWPPDPSRTGGRSGSARRWCRFATPPRHPGARTCRPARGCSTSSTSTARPAQVRRR